MTSRGQVGKIMISHAISQSRSLAKTHLTFDYHPLPDVDPDVEYGTRACVLFLSCPLVLLNNSFPALASTVNVE